MASLDDIWDAPLSEPPRRASSPVDLTADVSLRPASKRPRSSLFLESDSEDEGSKPPARKSVQPSVDKAEIDAMFDDLDAEPDTVNDLPPALDLDALRRQADEKNAKTYKKPAALDLSQDASGPGGDDAGEQGKKGSGKEKAQRKPKVVLDEAKLLGPDGFPALVRQAKTFKQKGKGHEATDLNRLLQVYQYWTHKMYPRTPFRETVKRAERLCHSKRMHVALSVWRDEYKGINSGRQIDPESAGSSSDEDEDVSKTETQPTQSNGDAHELGADAGSSSSRPPSRPPSSASEPASTSGFDLDLDAMIREDEEREVSVSNPAPTAPGSSARTIPQDEDDAMWDAFDVNVFADSAAPSAHPTSSTAANEAQPEDDEDMWDIVREMEASESNKPSDPMQVAPTPTEQQGGASQRPTNEEGWDEMYE